MDVFWFIPTQGDGRFLSTTDGGRPATFDYFAQLTRAADSLGYHGALLPTGRGCDDAWITAAGLAAVTTRLKYLVAVRPGLVSPTLAYRMAATFDRQTAGRVLINVVAGGDTDELHDRVLLLEAGGIRAEWPVPFLRPRAASSLDFARLVEDLLRRVLGRSAQMT